MRIPRIVVAGAASGVGKTSVACAVARALRGGGLSVRPFKVGPDYIDPGYLSEAAGAGAYNLDAWMMGRARLLESFARHSDADVSVIEGVMGYYDGHGGGSDLASTRHVASITRSPVVLVLDASGAARSVAAAALGFRRFHRDSRIAAVVLNGIGSARHAAMCGEALAGSGIPVVGAVPRDPSLGLESRHLGLVPAREDRRLAGRIRRMSGAVARHLDVRRILRIARSAPPLPRAREPEARGRAATVAVALDASFNFYYQDNLEALRAEGARLRFFSPVGDRELPRCDGIYIGGGFPEVLAAKLEGNGPMRASVRRAAEGGAPLYAECGGLMYLTRSVRGEGRARRMAGLLDADTVMAGRTLGYTRGRILPGSPVSGARAFRGHEFHYSRLESVAADSRFACALDEGVGIAGGRDGLAVHGTLASYGHLLFDRRFARGFVLRCAARSRR